MLKAEYVVTPTEMDLIVCEKLIPADPYLRRLKAASDVAVQRAQIDAMRSATVDVSAEQRLLARVTHLRALVVWGAQGQPRLRAAVAEDRPVATAEQATAFSAALAVAHKVLNDRAPKAQDKLLALVDTEARAGNHGDYYDGYLLEVSMEADSELSGALEVLPANGDEGANATSLLTSEEHAHGNDIARLSLDRIGFRGDLLAQLSEAVNGPQLTVYVPPLDWLPPAPELFQPAAFLLNDAREEVRCPGGATTRNRTRAERGHGWRFAFSIPQCRGCPVRAQCVNPDAQRGRTVIKSDSEAQDQAARQRAQTAAYPAVRREHPRIERKLAELVRWHAGRRSVIAGACGSKFNTC